MELDWWAYILLSEFFNFKIHVLSPVINHFESYVLLNTFQNTGSCRAEAMFRYMKKVKLSGIIMIFLAYGAVAIKYQWGKNLHGSREVKETSRQWFISRRSISHRQLYQLKFGKLGNKGVPIKNNHKNTAHSWFSLPERTLPCHTLSWCKHRKLHN